MTDALVLCYHAVSPTWSADLSVTPAALEGQLRGLLRRGYRGVPFSEAVTAGGGDPKLAVTFDDAYRSVLEIARPVLDRLGLPGTVFATTDHPGTGRPVRWEGVERWIGGPDQHELVPMDWDDLGRLAEAGWEVGSHTRSHPRLTALDDAALREELEGSRVLLEERLGRACRAVAYPYGDVDARVAAAATAAGYSTGAALPGPRRAALPLAWPRVGVYHGDGPRRFAMKVAPLTRRAVTVANRALDTLGSSRTSS
jgi:peptidoglycan/xylan/chitin deacetylase (PgdA/CDA1 family)